MLWRTTAAWAWNITRGLRRDLASAAVLDCFAILNNDGLDTNDQSGTASLVHSLNARNALSATYSYSNFSYPGYNISFETNTGLVGFQRKWTRNLATNFSAGPMYISSSVSSAGADSMDVAANASVTYILRFASASASYTRGTNGGGEYFSGQ